MFFVPGSFPGFVPRISISQGIPTKSPPAENDVG